MISVGGQAPHVPRAHMGVRRIVDFGRRSGTTRAEGPHGGATHCTCGEPNEIELTASRGCFCRSPAGTPRSSGGCIATTRTTRSTSWQSHTPTTRWLVQAAQCTLSMRVSFRLSVFLSFVVSFFLWFFCSFLVLWFFRSLVLCFFVSFFPLPSLFLSLVLSLLLCFFVSLSLGSLHQTYRRVQRGPAVPNQHHSCSVALVHD